MDQGRTGWSRAAEWYAVGLFLVYAVMALVHHGAPSLTDYANWTYQGVLLQDHLLGRPDAAHVLKIYPVPNSLITVGIGLLALVLPWLWAAKVWLIVQLALCWASMHFLLRTVEAPAVAWMVIPQAVFLNVNFWYGFMNFELGLAWLMVFAACLLRGTRDWVLAILLVLVFFTHMIPFCVCVLLLLADVMILRRWQRLRVLIPGVLLTGWYMGGRFLSAGNADGQAGMRETVRTYSAAFWVYKANSYAKSFGYSNPVGRIQPLLGKAGLFLLLAAEAGLALAVAWCLLRVARKADKGPFRFVWVALAMLVPIYLLTPGAALGISDPGARVLQSGLALALAFCWTDDGRRLQRAAAACAVVLAVGGLVLFTYFGGGEGRPSGASGVDGRFAAFARVPAMDQDYFYDALRRGQMDLPVFPTGMLLNRPPRP